MKTSSRNRFKLAHFHARGLLAASCCAAVLLSGCASFKGIETSATLRQPADYATTASLPEQHGQWPDTSWAQTIGGAPLQALVDEAVAGNTNLQGADRE